MPDDGQGSRFTSEAFTGLLEMERVRVSMDGKGYSDNIFVERLWHTVKYKEVYLKAHSSARGARAGFVDYFHFHRQPMLPSSVGLPNCGRGLKRGLGAINR